MSFDGESLFHIPQTIPSYNLSTIYCILSVTRNVCKDEINEVRAWTITAIRRTWYRTTRYSTRYSSRVATSHSYIVHGTRTHYTVRGTASNYRNTIRLRLNARTMRTIPRNVSYMTYRIRPITYTLHYAEQWPDLRGRIPRCAECDELCYVYE